MARGQFARRTAGLVGPNRPNRDSHPALARRRSMCHGLTPEPVLERDVSNTVPPFLGSQIGSLPVLTFEWSLASRVASRSNLAGIPGMAHRGPGTLAIIANPGRSIASKAGHAGSAFTCEAQAPVVPVGLWVATRDYPEASGWDRSAPGTSAVADPAADARDQRWDALPWSGRRATLLLTIWVNSCGWLAWQGG